MKFVPCSNMFLTTIECSNDDRKKLLEYVAFLFEDKVHEKVRSDQRFAPSHVWSDWANNTFLGFSMGRLLLQSGHAVPLSIPTNSIHLGAQAKASLLRRVYRAVRTVISEGSAIPTAYDLESMQKEYARFWGKEDLSKIEKEMARLKPMQFFLAKEIPHLAAPRNIEFLLEIGAGAGLNVAVHIALHGVKNITIVDLPESLFVSYITLRSLFPEIPILLPHEIGNKENLNKTDRPVISMALPYQVESIEENSFDRAVNMSSFQEMDIGVVNNYINFAYSRLKAGGSFISSNQKVARHIPGNSFENYDLAAFQGNIVTKNPPLHSHLSGKVGGEHIFLEATKED